MSDHSRGGAESFSSVLASYAWSGGNGEFGTRTWQFGPKQRTENGKLQPI
jgi:hypothetical protein